VAASSGRSAATAPAPPDRAASIASQARQTRPILVTRPAPEAALWVQALQAAGWPAQALPLIEIAPAADQAALQQARLQAGAYSAWMFVSAQAVQHFCRPDLPPAAARCWAPGPGTAAALVAAGIDPARIDQPPATAAQFDSEALWAVVQPQLHSGQRLLIVRGRSANGHLGRDWLQRQCAAAGVQVDSCIAYQRQPPVWDAGQRAQVQRWAQQGALCLCSSSEALQHLAALSPGTSWAQSGALVSHPRIAATARQMGFGEIIGCRPGLADVLHALSAQA